MNPIAALTEQTWILPVARALVHFLWQGALVAGLYAAARPLLRSSGARYAAGTAALAAMLALPILTTLSLAPEVPAEIAAAVPAGEGMAAGVRPAEITGTAGDPAARSTASPRLESLLPWLPPAWLAGVVVLSLLHLGGWWRAQRLRRATGPVPAAWSSLLEDLRRRLEIHRPVALRGSDRVDGPMVLGWLRPMILAPVAALAQLSPQQLEAILAHELAHVRRQDYLVNLLQVAVETLLFYNPAVWWVSRQVRIEREHCCDDLAAAACGDRLTVARALAELEGLRAPRWAPAAAGGPLLERVRRLVGSSGETGSAGGWMGIALASAVVIAGGTLALAVPGAPAAEAPEAAEEAAPAPRPDPQPNPRLNPNPQPNPRPRAEPRARSSAPAPGVESLAGRWTSERRGDRLQLHLEPAGRGESWRYSWGVPLDEIDGIASGAVARFEVRRDAGTFLFEGGFGGFQGDEGSGTFRFVENPGFRREMARFGHDLTDDNLYAMAFHDVSVAWVEELDRLGYRVPTDQLLAFRIHGVGPDFIRELAAAGYEEVPGEQLLAMRIHGVSPRGIAELAELGYEDLPVEQLLAFQIHGVTPERVQVFEELGYRNLAAEQLVAMQVHGVSPESIGAWRDLGYDDLPIERLVGMKVHGVTPARAEELADLGYGRLTLDLLQAMGVHGVDPEYIRGLEEVGLAGVPANQLVAMKVHGITPEYVREKQAEGYEDLTIESLLRLKIHGSHRR